MTGNWHIFVARLHFFMNATRDIDTAISSVRLSVRPRHYGIVSKWLNVSSLPDSAIVIVCPTLIDVTKFE